MWTKLSRRASVIEVSEGHSWDVLMAWLGPRSVALIGTVSVAALTGCAGVAHESTGTSASVAPGASAAAFSFDLYTHCGVRDAVINGKYFVVVDHDGNAVSLDDGNGNPPAGWGNPFQPGTMQFVSPTIAEFRDAQRHEVRFEERPAAATHRPLCS